MKIDSDERPRSSGVGNIGFFGALTILFIGLKLGNVIDWSWWWVLAPLWGPLAITLIVFIILASLLRRP